MSIDESPALESWIGRTEQVADEATRAPALALAATLDRDASGLERGDPLPPLWHWIYFTPKAPAREIGADGHPRARRLPAAGEPAAADVGRRPPRVPRADPDRRRADPHLDHRRRAPARRQDRRAGVRHRAPRDRARRPAAAHRGARHRLPRPAAAGRGAAPPERRRRPTTTGRATVDARSGAAVPLLGAHLQRPPHPLRPQLRDRGRGLSRADRARAADRHPAASTRRGGSARTSSSGASPSRRCSRCSTSIRSSSAAASMAPPPSTSGRAATTAGWR